jgi:arylsulfatase A
MICLADIMATCAEITGAKLPENAAEDSFSFLPLLKGGLGPVRETLVNHSASGQFAIREGNWKLIVGKPNCLYDMNTNESETSNVAAKHPEIVKRLTAQLQQIVADGRSTPGQKQHNDVPVKIIK